MSRASYNHKYNTLRTELALYRTRAIIAYGRMSRADIYIRTRRIFYHVTGLLSPFSPLLPRISLLPPDEIQWKKGQIIGCSKYVFIRVRSLHRALDVSSGSRAHLAYVDSGVFNFFLFSLSRIISWETIIFLYVTCISCFYATQNILCYTINFLKYFYQLAI